MSLFLCIFYFSVIRTDSVITESADPWGPPRDRLAKTLGSRTCRAWEYAVGECEMAAANRASNAPNASMQRGGHDAATQR